MKLSNKKELIKRKKKLYSPVVFSSTMLKSVVIMEMETGYEMKFDIFSSAVLFFFLWFLWQPP
jgi:hypothetical protein